MMSLMHSFHRTVSARRNAVLAALAALLLWPAAATAQFSDSYNFLKAVRDKDGAKVMDVLGKPGSTIVNTRDISTGETALHIVTAQRDLSWMSFLIAKGANTNATDDSGKTPLMLATELRFLEGADLLLSHGAQVDKTNNSGETALIRAVHIRDVPLIRLLVNNGANPDKRDTLAGMSARDYADRDARNPAITDILNNAKKAKPASGPVQGPVF